jgi:glycosyltransferase involved in cell wall biosynthesis
MVVSVHDVSFVAHPEWFSRREGLQRRLIGRLSARRATRILTFSDFSKREIVRHVGVDAEKVDVIYHGVTAFTERAFGPHGSMRARAPLILYAGSIFNRRHIPDVIEAFSRLAARYADLRLELVGENRTLPFVDVTALIAASGASGRIRARSYVTDAALAALYGEAAAFVFCSDYEGFGLTPLEALAAGIPIVVLDTEVTREIYGPAARYVATPDAGSIAAALEAVLFDPDERARILSAASSVLGRYSWRESAQRTLQVLLASA